MGQCSSSPALHSRHSASRSSIDKRAAVMISAMNLGEDGGFVHCDYISNLPDDCLVSIFHLLSSGDRKQCSGVCQRWLRLEGESRNRISLNAKAEIQTLIPKLFARFDSVTKLALRCDRRSVSIGDEALVMISVRCRNLRRVKLRGCREVTDAGIADFAMNCKGLKKLSFGGCTFGAKGINALLDYCSVLEELSVKRLRGSNDSVVAEPISPGAAAASLKSICLKELYNGQSFGPLIAGSKNLKTMKIIRCFGDWDKILESVGNQNRISFTEIHLERLQVGNIGLSAISKLSNLEILHLVKTPECTNLGLVSVANGCGLLRKLHIDGWRTHRIGDEGLIAVAKQCPNLQELVLIGMNPTSLSIEAIVSNCQNLERLALCGSETIGDAEISIISNKCGALKKLCIKGCPISDHGLESLAFGCPNLVKIKVKKCRGVTSEVANWLKMRRGSLVINLDPDEDASVSDGGAQEDVIEFPAMGSQAFSDSAPSSSNGRSALSKAKHGFFAGRNLLVSAIKRLSSGGGSSSSFNGKS